MVGKSHLRGTLCFVLSMLLPMAAIAGGGWLGVIVSDQSAGQDQEERVKIVDLAAGGPADKAGLEEGDIILKFDGNGVSSPGELRALVESTEPGAKKNILILRDGEEKAFMVMMGERTEDSFDKNIWTFKIPEVDNGEYNLFMGGEPVTRGYLGVTLQDMSNQLRNYFGTPKDRGVLIDGIEEDSPAERAGLKAGDVILSINGKEMRNSGQVQKTVRPLKEGETANVLVLRMREEIKVPVSIGEKNVPAFFVGDKEHWSDYIDEYVKGHSGENALESLKKMEIDEKNYTEAAKKLREAQRLLASENVKQALKRADEQLKTKHIEALQMEKKIEVLEKKLHELEKKLDAKNTEKEEAEKNR